MTNSNSAASRVRAVGLFVLSLALALPFMGTAQDPPPGGQGQKGGDPPKGDDKGKPDDKAKADEALKRIKDQARKDTGGEVAAPEPEDKNKPALARRKLEPVRNSQRIPMPMPSPAERQQINGGAANPALVLKWAKIQASLFTDPDQDKNVQRNHDVTRLIANSNAEYAALLKRQIFAVCEEFINKIDEPKISAVAKVNLISLIDELHSLDAEAAKELNGVQILLDALKNHERHGDGVLYAVVQTLGNAKKLGITTVDKEREAARDLMKIARRGELQPIFLEGLCRALGVIGMPFEGNVNEAVEIATFLANIAMNENLGERTRVEAATALGRLQKANLVINYAFDVEAWVIAKVYLSYLNWVIASKAAEQPLVGDNIIKYLGARIYDATRRSLTQASGANGEERLRTLLSTMEPSLKDIFDNKDPDREPIVQWLEQNKVQSLKLARRAAEIRPIVKVIPPQPPQGGAAAAGPGPDQ